MEERELRERICDAAIDLGEQRGWDAVHMHDVADTLGITLAELGRHYAQKDDIAEAWFDRADAALLGAAESSGWQALAVRERLHRAIFAWLDTLAPHRRITGQILRYKLQPEHLHLQALGLVRVSRTVQWIREVAQLPAVGWRREFEEIALTAIYLATFTRWLGDDSPGAQRSHAFLDGLLARVERAAWRMPA